MTMPSTPAPPRAASGTRYRSTSRVEEIDVWDTMQSHHLQGDDSSSSDEGLHPRRHQRSSSRNQQQQQKQQHLAPAKPRHGRSLSHPFLFFGRGRKKGDGSGDGEDDDDDDDDNGDDDDDYGIVRSSGGGGVSRSGNLAASGSAQRGHARGRSTAGAGTTNNSGSQDLAVGRCMTCSSLVRWPKDLPAFRCSICLTINDLPRQTVGGGHRRTGSGVVVPEVAVTGDDQSQQSELRGMLAFYLGMVLGKAS
jgi:E3 ubiquitin-protein ligase HECTD2